MTPDALVSEAARWGADLPRELAEEMVAQAAARGRPVRGLLVNLLTKASMRGLPCDRDLLEAALAELEEFPEGWTVEPDEEEIELARQAFAARAAASAEELVERARLVYDVALDPRLASLVLELGRGLGQGPTGLLSKLLARCLTRAVSLDEATIRAVAGEMGAIVEAAATQNDELPSPLHRAIDARDLEELRALIAGTTGLDRGAHEHDGRTPLGHAVASGWAEGVEALLAAGADPNRGGYSAAPIHDAMTVAGDACLRQLLAAGADPNALAEEEITPVMCFEGDEDLDKVLLLLAAGADPGWVDKTGETALHRARSLGAHAIAAELERHLT